MALKAFTPHFMLLFSDIRIQTQEPSMPGPIVPITLHRKPCALSLLLPLGMGSWGQPWKPPPLQAFQEAPRVALDSFLEGTERFADWGSYFSGRVYQCVCFKNICCCWWCFTTFFSKLLWAGWMEGGVGGSSFLNRSVRHLPFSGLQGWRNVNICFIIND